MVFLMTAGFERLMDLPIDVHLVLFDYLPKISSACLGLTCKRFYDIHWKRHGRIALRLSVRREITYRHGRMDRMVCRVEDISLYSLLKSWMWNARLVWGGQYNIEAFITLARKQEAKKIVFDVREAVRHAKDYTWELKKQINLQARNVDSTHLAFWKHVRRFGEDGQQAESLLYDLEVARKDLRVAETNFRLAEEDRIAKQRIDIDFYICKYAENLENRKVKKLGLPATRRSLEKARKSSIEGERKPLDIWDGGEEDMMRLLF